MPTAQWQLNNNDQQLFDLALREDLNFPYLDITTKTLFKNISKPYKTKIISKHTSEIIICGIPIIDSLLKKITSHYEIQSDYRDGDILKPGQTLLTITSDPKTLLMLERTLLNFLRRLSAIATLTKQFVQSIQDTSTKILDTRKTTPGQRHLEKYAVQCGGGVNHRMGLYDAYMIKDTHIDLIGDLEKTIALLPSTNQNKLPVIFEVRTLKELETVIQFGKNKVTRVLLDNMTNETLKQAIQKAQPFFETEASGNITLNTIVSIAKTGVDFASVGMLTYAAGQVDLSMQAIKGASKNSI